MRIKIIIFALIIALSSTVYAGEKSEKAGEVIGETAKKSKDAGKKLLKDSKGNFNKALDYIKELFEDTKESAKDFKEGFEKGYKKEKKEDSKKSWF